MSSSNPDADTDDPRPDSGRIDLDSARSLLKRGLSDPHLTGGASEQWEPPEPEELSGLFPGFEIIELAGRGGMGAVYKACQLSLDRLVAIKILPLELSVEPGFTERFRREAQAMAKLSHPNIVSVYDYGETSEGGFYILMEFVEGSDLQGAIARGEIGFADGVRLTRQICDGLEHAHREGFVHRDVKPGNILLDTEGNARISDFGVARLRDNSEPDVLKTVAGGVVGTPAYIAPEQLKDGSKADHRADIFSLGVILYELLTGELPLGAFQPPSKRAEDVDARMDSVVERAIQPTPDRRYQSAADMGDALDSENAGRSKLQGLLGIAAVTAIGMIVTILIWRPWDGEPADDSAKEKANSLAPFRQDRPYTNSLGMKLVPIRNNELVFCIHETRIRDYAEFVNTTGHPMDAPIWYYDQAGLPISNSIYSWKSPPGYTAGLDHPVASVSWPDALAFCKWLTEKERLAGLIPDHLSYSLPSEVEWETASGRTIYPWGNEWPPPEGAGNFSGEEMRNTVWSYSRGIIPGWTDDYSHPAPVGTFAPDGNGLFDVAGNVCEWLLDTAGPGSSKRIVMAGAWVDGAEYALTIRHRTPRDSDDRYAGVGFRIVLAARPVNGQ